MPRRQDDKRTHSEALADFVVDVLDDMKAESIRRIDVRDLMSVMDFMVVASGRSDRHVRALADRLLERCKEAGYRPLGVEGQKTGEWILVDLNDVVVHVMLPSVREFYGIEKLWGISALEDAADTRPH